jgi:predicted MFS family arabinose efflux permease
VNPAHPNDSRTSPYRWLILAAATVLQAGAAFVTQGIAVLAGYLQKDLHLSTTEVGLLITASSVAPIFTLLFVGDLLDRKSERSIIVAGMLIMAAGLVGAGVAPGLLALCVALFVVGMGYSTVQPGGSRSVSQWFNAHQLGIAMGVRQAGLPLGGAAAAAALPFLVGLQGWRAAFLWSVAVVLAVGLLFWAIYRPPHLPDQPRKRAVLTVFFLVRMVRQRWMQRVVWSGMALVGTQYGIVVFLMLFLRDRFGMPLREGGWLLLLIQLCGGVGRIALSVWSDRRGRTGDRFLPVAASMVATCLGLLALLNLPVDVSRAWLLGLVAVLGFFALGWYGPWVTYIADSAPADSVGLALGTAMTVNQIAIVLVPPALGMLRDATGSYDAVWGALIGWVAVTLLLLWWARGAHPTALQTS